MKLKALLEVVDEAYPDGMIGQARKNPNCGDGLASFIVSELTETFESSETTAQQLERAISTMVTARRELDQVVRRLEFELYATTRH